MEVAVPFNSLSQQQVQLVQNILEDDLKKPLTLNIKVIPTQEYIAN
jgi:hypothetical protein